VDGLPLRRGKELSSIEMRAWKLMHGARNFQRHKIFQFRACESLCNSFKRTPLFKKKNKLASCQQLQYSSVPVSCSPLFVPFPSPPATSKQPMRSSCTFSRDFTCEDESSPHSDNARDNANLSAFCLHPSRLLCREETKTVVSLNTKYTAKQRSRGLQNI